VAWALIILVGSYLACDYKRWLKSHIAQIKPTLL